MVTRTIEVLDNDFLTVAEGSPSLSPGSAIINNSDTPNGTIFQFSGGAPVTVSLDDKSRNKDVLEDDSHERHTVIDGGGVVQPSVGIEAESLIFLREIDDAGNRIGPTIEVVVFSQGGITRDVWGFHSDHPLVAGKQYVKVGGSNRGSISYSEIETQPVCYAMGTLIQTPNGPIAVERLEPGGRVQTLDHGPQTIRWIHGADQSLETVRPDAKPVLISAGALGPGIPAHDLVVSNQHRILLGGAWQFSNWKGGEVFAPAKSLTSLPGIRFMNGKRSITWLHFACDQHEVVMANGCLSESLLLGPMALAAMPAAERKSVVENFGPADTPEAALNGPPARGCLGAGLVRRRILAESQNRTKRLAGEIAKWDADAAASRIDHRLNTQGVVPTRTNTGSAA